MNKLKLDRNIPIVPCWRENLKEPSVNDLKWMIDRQLFWYCLFIFTNKFMNTTFMHLSIQLAQIRKFRIRPTFHFLDILGPAVEWSAMGNALIVWWTSMHCECMKCIFGVKINISIDYKRASKNESLTSPVIRLSHMSNF